MRKISLIFYAGLICIVTSCNDTATSTETKSNAGVQKNLSADSIIGKAFETGDVSSLDNVVATDFVDHTDRGDIKGIDSLKAMIKMVRATNKDMKMEPIRVMADDEYVFSWMRFRGTSDGTMMPAGPYDMQAIEVTKYKDAKAVEHWEFMELKEMVAAMQKK
jgi:predicted SnoaL-like aldol condensation-catalyzing enzyme